MTSSADTIALTIDEAAETLRLSEKTVRTLLARETYPIPSFRYGRRVVIPRRELVEWTANEAKGTHS